MTPSASPASGSAEQPRETPGPVQRTVDLLLLLAEAEGSIGIRDVAKTLGVPPSSSHRLLRQLVDAGFASVDLETRRYEVGPLFHRAAALVQARASVATTAQPFLDQVTAECGETSLFAIFQSADASVTFVAKADSAQALSYRIDLNVPLSAYWGSSSQVIAAYLPEADLRRVLDNATRSPVRSVPPMPEAKYRTLLAEIRKRGFALTRGEKLPGAVGTTAPVFDTNGIVGSLTVTIPEVRFRPSMRSEIQRLVVGAAAQLSQTLGHRGDTPLP